MCQNQRQDAGAESQLSLLETRVRKHILGNRVIEVPLNRLGETILELGELKPLSDETKFNTVMWLAGGSLTDQISQFMNAAFQRNILDELIVLLAARHPDMFVDSKEN